MKLLPIVLLGFVAPHASAQFLVCSPVRQIVPGEWIIQDGGSGHFKFKYAGAESIFTGTPVPDASNYLLLVPSSGTTPAAVQVDANPFVAAQLKPGGHHPLVVTFTTVDQTPASTVHCEVDLFVPAQLAPSIQSVVNAASLQPFLSPGAQASIIGTHLTGPTLSTNYDPTASYPTSVAGTTVTFNGIAAPLLRLSPGKIRAIVPFTLAGQTSVQVVVHRFDQTSDTFTLPLQDTSPGIFTSRHDGTGAGPILQQGSDGQFTPNSPDDPAAAGTALKIFATGAGAWSAPPQSDVFIFGENFTTQPVSLTIGGQPANNTWSVLQVNPVVPDGVSSGPQPVVLTVGENDNAQQQVTIWVQ
jgi:uncharacterized protein (TIGR03437 family)